MYILLVSIYSLYYIFIIVGSFYRYIGNFYICNRQSQSAIGSFYICKTFFYKTYLLFYYFVVKYLRMTNFPIN